MKNTEQLNGLDFQTLNEAQIKAYFFLLEELKELKERIVKLENNPNCRNVMYDSLSSQR